MAGAEWTEDQLQLLRQLYEQPDVNIATLETLLQRSRRAIYHKVMALGLRRPDKSWMPEEIATLTSLYTDPNVLPSTIQVKLQRSWTAIKIRANQLGLYRPKRNQYSVNRQYFHVIESDVKAYLLGLLAADGAVSPAPTYSVTLMLQFRDRMLIERFRDELGGQLPITINRNTYAVTASSKEICSDLARYGIVPRKSSSYNWPEELPEEFAVPFILGYFDGDGTLCQVVDKGHLRWRWALLGCHDFLLTVKGRIESLANVRLCGPARAPAAKSQHLFRIYSANQSTIDTIDRLLNTSQLGLPRKHFSE